ncbi:phosphate ABC transporter permease subunit PstC [Malaciobacter molluscorum LMG 25693]|uniref:Phosphate transport system permease protein n=1 Tax=Malaciobacter molluscorum LMG 25693 TaxID=870501 RepID=A0A2G1DKT2_9BACT|nr:phosphate ABC transporter permease subunit PstC [Malaciobacter molluscorum]AXX92706.1 phosphate ABC transporter, permease protein [Malaciobacter molluscorum LMG 25693]PHO19123.1 phosphate ABC transporter permease subunit PstC [Malaciobacter molluscorum LMG 25693]RXJ97437.1 phosphate ABC transporter permease subunit PstC [Malaciobacter molluscorum]
MEKIFKNMSLLSASIVLVILIGIFFTLFLSSKQAMDEFGLSFVTNPAWQTEVALNPKEAKNVVVDEYSLFPDEEPTKTIYGGLVPIVGTILSTLIALVFALPIAMGIAVFLAEIAPKNVSHVVGIAIELLAAIPSIIFGMWGLFYFAPIIQKIVGGYQVSLLTAGLVLGIMILPFMAAITRDSMKTTPDILKESAYALGATKFEVIKDVIFPYSKVGIIGSIILALGRALGETMAVAFLIGSVFELPKAINSPTISIPVALANNFGEATGLGASSLFYLAFLLFLISFIVISIAKFYFLKKVKK